MQLAPAALLDMLIVDDDADTRELLAEHCAAKGYRVATAQDGLAATTVIERARPPLPVVIADLHLPHADGFAVLDAARQANASCYVIIITGYATIDSAVRAVQAGAYDFLPKPFALRQLEILLARIRDRMALESENSQLTRQMDDDRSARGRVPAINDRLRRLEDRIATLERIVLAEPRR
jgi:DNA-binding NtrC family response regulator